MGDQESVPTEGIFRSHESATTAPDSCQQSVRVAVGLQSLSTSDTVKVPRSFARDEDGTCLHRTPLLCLCRRSVVFKRYVWTNWDALCQQRARFTLIRLTPCGIILGRGIVYEEDKWFLMCLSLQPIPALTVRNRIHLGEDLTISGWNCTADNRSRPHDPAVFCQLRLDRLVPLISDRKALTVGPRGPC